MSRKKKMSPRPPKLVLVKVPLRLEFMGGSTDIASFYTRYTGRVLNAALNKYIYVLVREIDEPRARFVHDSAEDVPHARKLSHARTRAALAQFGRHRNIEVISRGDLPGGSGLGASSSFSVAILHALGALAGSPPRDARALAEHAAHLEIDVLKEPIGKQDQYAAAFGGINFLTFNNDGWVDRKEITLSQEAEQDFYRHLLVFGTGSGHSASEILGRQKKNERDNFEHLKKMSDLIPAAVRALQKGDLKRFAEFLYEEWTIKKNLTAGVTTPELEAMYAKAARAGAWGGRVSGAGGGGFMFFLAPPSRHAAIRKALASYETMEFRFVREGSAVLALH